MTVRRAGLLLGLAAAGLGNLIAIWIDQLVLRRQITPSGWGGPGDFLIFQQGSRAVLEHLQSAGELMYPPPFLLLSAPFSTLPPQLGCILWILAGGLILVLAARRFGMQAQAIMLGLASPPVLYCAVMGQCGMFVSAALLLALGMADTAPVLAGIAAGCVVIKPQFALLLPICFLAARRWRTIIAAAFTVLCLCVLPAILFGGWAWHLFLHAQLHVARGVVSNPGWLVGRMMVTAFILFRNLGASVLVAGTAQALVTVAAAVACWMLWARAMPQTMWERVAATLFLVILATPYAYIYDLPAQGFALLAYAYERRPNWPAAVALFWLFTGAYGFTSTFFWPVGAFIAVAIVAATWPRDAKVTASP